MMIHVDEALTADAEAVALLVGELLHEIMTAVNDPVFAFDLDDTQTRIRTWIDANLYTVLLARERGQRDLLGVLTLSESRALYTEGVFGTIPEFFVRPAYRSQGIGAALVEAAVRLARRRGWRRLEATTPPLPAFERTLSFYQRQGFCVTGGRKLKVTLA